LRVDAPSRSAGVSEEVAYVFVPGDGGVADLRRDVEDVGGTGEECGQGVHGGVGQGTAS